MLNKKISAIIASVLIAGNTFLTADLSSEWFMAPVTVSAAASDDALYTFEEYDDHAELEICEDNYASDITVPREYNGLPVTVIGTFAFTGCKGLRSVTLPDTVTTIKDLAFAECDDLESVTIPDSVTTIEIGAFAFCRKLETLVIPDSVTEISESAYMGCDNLKTLVIPESTTIIKTNLEDVKQKPVEVIKENSLVVEDGVLVDASQCEGDIVIPDYVTAIDYEAFKDNEKLTSVIIPDSVTRIGSSAFYGCSNLKSVVISGPITSINYQTFRECSALESVTLPDSVIKIYEKVFWGCTNLKSINLPDSLISIGAQAFWYCESLESLTIPESLTSIGTSAFSGTPWLDKQMTEKNPFAIVNGILIAANCNLCSEEVIIPDSVKSIAKDALVCLGSDKIKSITVPSSVTSIGMWAFDSPSSLTILNPDCKIRRDMFLTKDLTVISGFAGSTAQKYAEKYGYKFETLPEDYGTEPEPDLTRDVNEDGVVNMADVICLTKNLLAFSGSSDFTAYDVNGDGQFNIMDLLAVKRAFL